MKTSFIMLLMILLFLGSCSKDDKILQDAEQLLPGAWTITSIQLPKYGLGITYQGHTFIADTTIYNVGKIVISDFSLDQLGSPFGFSNRIGCELTIGSESFPYSINELFLSGDDLFSQFRYDGPDGALPLDTPGLQFLFSSFAFNNNYIIEIEDSDHLRLLKANDQSKHMISLTRQ